MATQRKPAEDKVIKQDTGSALRSSRQRSRSIIENYFLLLVRPDYRPLSQILPSKNKFEG